MIVSCEKCGKKYQIDPEQIRGEVTTFQCESCNSVITVAKQENNPSNAAPPKAPPRKSRSKASPLSAPKKGGIGLRSKMFFLFFFVPILLIVASNIYLVDHMRTLSGLITKDSSQLVTKMAREVQLYLETHPDLQREDFNTTPEFVAVASQRVGQTGYTVLMSRATETEPDYMWVHPDQELIGIDIVKAMKERLGADYENWARLQGKPYEIGGYYKWFDGSEKYTYAAPAKGTNFNIAATSQLSEFTLPVQQLEHQANALITAATNTVMIILIATAIIVAFLVISYSYRLSGRLRSLADAADRISVGNLDVEIAAVKSRDEIGHLTSALSRMQTSIRLAIKRLRERR